MYEYECLKCILTVLFNILENIFTTTGILYYMKSILKGDRCGIVLVTMELVELPVIMYIHM